MARTRARLPIGTSYQWQRLFLGLLVGLIVGAVGIPGDSEWGWGGLLVATLVVAVSLVVGLIAAIVALLRSERRWGLTALGFAINLAPALVFLARIILAH